MLKMNFKKLGETFFVLVFLNIVTWTKGQQLECYSCVSVPGDLTCLTNPELLTGRNVVNCGAGWCTIIRQEQTEIPGQITSFRRQCQTTEPLILDDVIADAHHVFFYRSCRLSRCNDGDGLEGRRPGGGSGDDNGLFIAPEERGSSASQTAPVLLFSLLPFLGMVLRFY